MLSEEQVQETFSILSLPPERAIEGSPIYIECPFKDQHTKPTRTKDARLYFDDVPHVWCFHESCREARKELNYVLRVAVLGTSEFPPSEKISFQYSPSRESLLFAEQVGEQREKIFRKFARRLRPLARVEISPVEFLTQLFKSDETVVWVGLKSHTGQPRHVRHFRSLAEWQKTPPPLRWCYTTGCTFKPGSVSRCAAGVLVRRYLILESDELSMDQTRALFEWVEYSLEVKLRAIVFSGNKSLHGWFDFPGPQWLADLRPTLLAAGFCSGPLNTSQPVRLGNALRETGEEQTILWM